MTYKRRIHKCGFASLPFLREKGMKKPIWNPDTSHTISEYCTNSTLEKHEKAPLHDYNENPSVTIFISKVTKWKHKQAKSVKPHPHFYAVTLLKTHFYTIFLDLCSHFSKKHIFLIPKSIFLTKNVCFSNNFTNFAPRCGFNTIVTWRSEQRYSTFLS